jgi:hypothetical protein
MKMFQLPFLPLHALRNSQNWSQNACPNMPLTLTHGSYQATQFYCCTPFSVTMSFSRVLFAVAIFSFSCTYCAGISSVVYVVIKDFNFSTLSCATCFIIPCTTASSSVTMNGSSCNESIFYARFYCLALIWLIS